MTEKHSASYSLRVLKRRLKQSNLILWNVFVHLTYNNEHLDDASSQDIRRLMNKIKQFNRNNLRKYQKRESGKYLDQVKYPRWKKIYEYHRAKNQRFVYCWKVEFDSKGVRTWNPHFHILMASPFYLSKSKIKDWWGKGFVEVKGIFDTRTARNYVSKYMSKDTSLIKRWDGRHWGHSRNLPKDVKKWTYEGLIDVESAVEITAYQKQEILYGYKIGKALKNIRKVKPVFADYNVSPIRDYAKQDLKEVYQKLQDQDGRK